MKSNRSTGFVVILTAVLGSTGAAAAQTGVDALSFAFEQARSGELPPVPAAQARAAGEPLDKNSPAHIYIWKVLTNLHQIDDAFSEAGQLQIQDFLFWNPRDGVEQKRRKAAQLALKIDGLFTGVLDGERKSGNAAAELSESLEKGDNSLRWLADRIDGLYKFKAAEADALDTTRRAHKTTWTTLRVLNQIDEVFGESGKIKVSALPFWQENRLGSKAGRMASAIDGVFVGVRGAGRRTEAAPAELGKVLERGKSEGRNILWLADQIAGLYEFLGE